MNVTVTALSELTATQEMRQNDYTRYLACRGWGARGLSEENTVRD